MLLMKISQLLPIGGQGASMFRTQLLMFLMMVAPAAAQGPSSWIGQKVVIKPDCSVKLEGRIVQQNGFHVYSVEQAEGDQLLVVSGSVKGWILASQAVPFDHAINFAAQQIAASPGNSAAWRFRGAIWIEKQEYDKAIADFNEAIRLDPKFVVAYKGRGVAWLFKNEYDKAIADFNEAIRLDRKDALAYSNRGNAWQEKGNTDNALADYNEAIRIDPNNAAAYANRTIVWVDRNEIDKAMADFNKAIKLEPMTAALFAGRAQSGQKRRCMTRPSPT